MTAVAATRVVLGATGAATRFLPTTAGAFTGPRAATRFLPTTAGAVTGPTAATRLRAQVGRGQARAAATALALAGVPARGADHQLRSFSRTASASRVTASASTVVKTFLSYTTRPSIMEKNTSSWFAP